MNPKTENASKAAGFTVLLVTQRRTVNASSEAFFLFVILQPHAAALQSYSHGSTERIRRTSQPSSGDITRIDITMMGQLIHTSFALLPIQRLCEQERHP